MMSNLVADEYSEESQQVIQNKSELLCRAAKTGDVETLSKLLAAGADINGVHEHWTPLMNAIQIEVIEFLLTCGADVNVKTYTTALINLFSLDYRFEISSIFSCDYRSEQMDQKLIERVSLLFQYDVNLEETDYEGFTALLAGIKSGCGFSVLKLLIDKGSNINHQNTMGDSALHICLSHDRITDIDNLLRNGANVNIENNECFTPLHLALRDVNVVKLLLENQADVDAIDNEGNTALQLLAKKLNFYPNEVVAELIKYGCDVNHVNNEGMSALLLAAKCLNEDFMSALLKSSDVDVHYANPVRRRPETALSLVLNMWEPCERVERERVAMWLLDRGATSEYVRADVMHRLIVTDNDRSIVHKLIIHGLCPEDIALNTCYMTCPVMPISAFMLCLLTDQIQLASYFLGNRYLTKPDIETLSRKKNILDYMDGRNAETSLFLKEISSQPQKLELLCFITVSSILGTGPDRREKVDKCPIPKILQEHLMYSRLSMKDTDIYQSQKYAPFSLDLIRLKSQLLVQNWLYLLPKCRDLDENYESEIYWTDYESD